MNIRKRRPFHDEDAMSAMNDIMFFLLLFFLIISTMANPNVIKVLLPKSDQSNAQSKQPISVTVTDDLRYYVNTTEVSKAQLEQELANASVNNTDQSVVLRIGKEVKHQDVVDVLAAGARLKLKMVFSVSRG
jgi:biopolymer transport protein ExbD